MTTALTDTRDMFAVHSFLRREFRLASGVVRAVADGDTKRAQTVCDHLDFLTLFLHLHHTGEDRVLWPRLLERVPEELAPIVHLMEEQHHRVDSLLQEIARVQAAWQSTALPAEREELARLFDELYVSLAEHLEAEEDRLLPIAARNITEAEWKQLGEEGLKSLPKSRLPLVLGMIQYEGDPDVVAAMIAETPRLIRALVPRLSRRAFRTHAQSIHGTPTP